MSNTMSKTFSRTLCKVHSRAAAPGRGKAMGYVKTV